MAEEVTVCEVDRADAVDLLTGLGFKLADKIKDNNTLANRLARAVAAEDIAEKSESLTAAQQELLDDLSEGDIEIEVVGGEEPPKATKKGKGKAVKTAKTAKAKVSSNGHASKEKIKKGPGVISTIIECLSGASPKKPVTKEAILKVLLKRFPDREEKAMKSTIASQVPSGLRIEKKVEVSKNDNGYWLPKEEQAKLKK